MPRKIIAINFVSYSLGKHLMLVTDAENPNDQYAFDNPCFRGMQTRDQSMANNLRWNSSLILLLLLCRSDAH